MTSSKATVTQALHAWMILAAMLLSTSFVQVARSCTFPDAMIMGRDDPPWQSQVKRDGSGGGAGGDKGVQYYVRRSVMEVHFSHGDRHHTRWKCTLAVGSDYKLLLKREDHHANSYYRCAKFHLRSASIVQISWSDESKVFDIGHCDDDRLRLDPWVLVRYETLSSDFSRCPFSGGYDMKVTDSRLGENGCNLMHRPMRMEVECVGGEGVTFDFISSSCLPDIDMHSKQQTLCVASWQHDGRYFSILRKNEDSRLWCLVVPTQRGTTVKGFLYSDLICRGGEEEEEGGGGNSLTGSGKPGQDLKYFILDLRQRNFPTLCEDEYSECSSTECNAYFKQECKKSCNACNGTSRVKSCVFPKRFKGTWFLKYHDALSHVEMKDSEMAIQGVGRFQCAVFPDSPARKTRIYTTVSVYDNGCRPRYTCLKLQRLAPAVFSYGLSQSYVWPAVKENFGQTICDPDRFQADPAPVEDLYRSHSGSGKPVVALAPEVVPVNCNLSSVLTLSATLPEGFVCAGTMFTHCQDPTRLRLNFASCSGLIDTVTDYRCLANYEGHYWERILLIQSLNDEADAVCFVFNQLKPNEAFVMVAGECDQNAFNFAQAGVRTPILTVRFREEAETCRSVPTATTTTKPPPAAADTDSRRNHRHHHHHHLQDSNLLPSGQASLHSNNNRTHADQGRAHGRGGSVKASMAPPKKSDRQRAGEADKVVSRHETGYDVEESRGSGNSARKPTIRVELLFILVYTFYVAASRCSSR